MREPPSAVFRLKVYFTRLLAPWLADQPAGQPFWPGTWAEDRQAAAMLRKNLDAAGILYEEDGRVFDFHALRGQFASSLARAGVHPCVAQLLLRHSKADLTLAIYSPLGLVDLQAGLDALPPLPIPARMHPSKFARRERTANRPLATWRKTWRFLVVLSGLP